MPHEIPNTYSAVPEQLTRDRGQDTMREALSNVAGITFNAGEGGRIGDNMNIRGFSAANDIYIDGIKDVGQYNRDLFNTDEVEVLKGGASMLFGRGTTGGVINQVSKQAYLDNQGRVSATLGFDNYQRIVADVNRVIADDAAVRINAMYTGGEPGREGPTTERKGIAPSVRWGIGSANEFDVAYYHLDYDDNPDYGFRWRNGRPVDEAAQKWYGLRQDTQRDSADIGTLRWTHRFDGQRQLRTVARYGEYKRDLWATTAGVNSGNGTGQWPLNAPITDATPVVRGNQTRGGEYAQRFLQSDYTADEFVFGMQHQIAAGIEIGRESDARWSYTGAGTKPAATIGDARNDAAVIDKRVRANPNSFDAESLAFYAQDLVGFAAHWKLLIGARHDDFSGRYVRTPSAADPNPIYERSDGKWSYRTGLLFQPDDFTTYYLSAGSAFATSGDLYQFDARSANTPPEESRNIELGAKWVLFDGAGNLSAAVFRTEKYHERNTDVESASQTNYLLSGKRHTNGVEVSFAGALATGWQVYGSYTYMNALIDAGAASQVGQVPGNTPRHSGSLWTTYAWRAWKVGTGVQGMSGRTPPENYTNRAPGYARWDAMAEYNWQRYTLRVNFDNLLDKLYYDGLYRGHVVPGVGRSGSVTLDINF
nr:TonB-dependent siderophore receptor [Niveibacterium umoris]